jgi:hypothetical protein
MALVRSTHFMRDRLPRSSAPHYMLLKNFDWIDGFLETEVMIESINKLKSEKGRIQSLPVPQDDVMAVSEQYYQKYREERIKKIRLLLNRGRLDGDFLKYLGADSMPSLILKEEIEEAIASLPERESMSLVEKELRIRKIDDEILSLSEKLMSKNDPLFFEIANGKIKKDIRQEFVSKWFQVQKTCNEACTVHCVSLSFSDSKEQEAYEKLGIAAGINRDSKYCPFYYRD